MSRREAKTTRAPESRRMYSHSFGRCCSYMGTHAAPTPYVAYAPTAHSGRFFEMTATLSPGAARCAHLTSIPEVQVSELDPRMTAEAMQLINAALPPSPEDVRM